MLFVENKGTVSIVTQQLKKKRVIYCQSDEITTPTHKKIVHLSTVPPK